MLDERLREATDGVKAALTELTPPPMDGPLRAAGRRTRWWAIAVAAAATVFLVIGVIALIGPFAERNPRRSPIRLRPPPFPHDGPGDRNQSPSRVVRTRPDR